MSQVLYILLGIVLLEGANYLVTLAFMFFYFFVAKARNPWKNTLWAALILSLANFFTQFLTLVVLLRTGVIIYPVITFFLSFLVYFAIMNYYLKYHKFENLIISVSLAILLNPIWLIIFGILR